MSEIEDQNDLKRDRKTASNQSICLQSEKENFAQCLNLSFFLLSLSLFFLYNSAIHHPFPTVPYGSILFVCVCVPLFNCFPTISPHARTLRGRATNLICCFVVVVVVVVVRSSLIFAGNATYCVCECASV